MEVTHCTMADFAQILKDIADFWGSDRTLHLHHPSLIRQFGNTAYVIKDGETVAAYLFGFFSQIEPAAYTHLIAVRSAYRRQGLAERLYERFIADAKARGCTAIQATAQAWNSASIAFHKSIGMSLLGEPNADGIPVVKDYGGPGVDRVLFRKSI